MFSHTLRAPYMLAFVVLMLVNPLADRVFAMDAVSCPSLFTLEEENATSITCLSSATVVPAPPAGVAPNTTAAGVMLIQERRDICQGASGSASAGNEGADGIFVRCVIDKPEPAAPPPAAPTPPSAPEPEPESFDFDAPAITSPDPTVTNIAESLATVCNGFLTRDDLNAAESDLLGRCRDINNEPDSQRQLDALQNIAARQYAEIANLIRFQNVIQVGNIGNRLASMRSVMSQTSRDTASAPLVHPAQGLFASTSSNASRGGAAGDSDGLFSRFGAFALAADGSGDKDQTDIASGFDYSSSSVSIGIDYLVNSSTIVGVAFGYGESDSQLANGSGAIDIETSNINLYGSKYFNRGWYVDGIIGAGRVDTENLRSIDFSSSNTNVSQDAVGQFDSSQSIFSLGVGRAIDGIVDVDIAARVNYITMDIDRFSEVVDTSQQGFGLALEIDASEVTSLTSDISVSVSKPFSYNWGVLVPTFTTRWIHEFERGDEQLFGRFLADASSFNFEQSGVALGDTRNGSTVFAVPLEEVDQNYGNVLLGVTALFPNQISANFGVSRTVGLSNFDHTYFSFTLRRDFQ